jgi:hypothetical protein
MTASADMLTNVKSGVESAAGSRSTGFWVITIN